MKGWIIGISKSILAFFFVFSFLIDVMSSDSPNLESSDEFTPFIAMVVSALSLLIFAWLLIKERIATKKVLLNIFYAILMGIISFFEFSFLIGDSKMALNYMIEHVLFFLMVFIFISYLFIPTVDSTVDD